MCAVLILCKGCLINLDDDTFVKRCPQHLLATIEDVKRECRKKREFVSYYRT